MQKYSNNFQDTKGNAIVGASVTVYTAGTTNLATIYSDNAGTVTANPQTTDTEGEFSFYAADGRYDIKVTKAGYTTQNYNDQLLFDPAASTGALGVGFLQSGTGATAVNLQSKVREFHRSAEDFGAVGDGTTDDTGKIQAAIDAAYTAGGGTVLLPAPSFAVTSLAVKPGVRLLGIENAATSSGVEGNARYTKLVYATSTTNPCIDFNSALTTRLGGAQLEKLFISRSDNTGTCIRIQYATQIKMRQIYTSGGSQSLLMSDVWDSSVLQAHLLGAVNGLKITNAKATGGTAVNNANDIKFIDLNVESFLRRGIEIIGFNAAPYRNNLFSFFAPKIESGAIAGGTYTDAHLVYLAGAYFVTFMGGQFIPTTGSVLPANFSCLNLAGDCDGIALRGTYLGNNGLSGCDSLIRLSGDEYATYTTRLDAEISVQTFTNNLSKSVLYAAAGAHPMVRVKYIDNELATGELHYSAAGGASVTALSIDTGPKGVSPDFGDTDFTLTVGNSATTVYINTAITADHAITLSTSNVYNGAQFTIVRGPSCTGAHNLNVGTGPLKALGSASTWCTVTYSTQTSAWILTASGSL